MHRQRSVTTVIDDATERRQIEQPQSHFTADGHQVVIGTSVGIAIAPTDGTEPDQLLKNADMALYRAKSDGRGALRFFEATMDAKMHKVTGTLARCGLLL